MLKKELLKLTPEERDVIYLWRILSYPRTLSVEEIQKVASAHSVEFIENTIKKFNYNCRLRLEVYQHNKNLGQAFGLIFLGGGLKNKE
jgi:hypothetical protein